MSMCGACAWLAFIAGPSRTGYLTIVQSLALSPRYVCNTCKDRPSNVGGLIHMCKVSARQINLRPGMRTRRWPHPPTLRPYLSRPCIEHSTVGRQSHSFGNETFWLNCCYGARPGKLGGAGCVAAALNSAQTLANDQLYSPFGCSACFQCGSQRCLPHVHALWPCPAGQLHQTVILPVLRASFKAIMAAVPVEPGW